MRIPLGHGKPLKQREAEGAGECHSLRESSNYRACIVPSSRIEESIAFDKSYKIEGECGRYSLLYADFLFS